MAAPRGRFTLDRRRRARCCCSRRASAPPRCCRCCTPWSRTAPTREVWWLHGARNSSEHPFAAEVRGPARPAAQRPDQICYSAPLHDRRARTGLHPSRPTGGRLPRRACRCRAGRARLHLRTAGVHDGHAGRTRPPRAWTRRACAPRCSVPVPASTPGIAAGPVTPPHPPDGEPGDGPGVTFARSGLTVPWRDDVRQPARARRGLRRPDPLVMPHRGLPHLRGRPARRDGDLRPAACRPARRRQRAGLLFSAQRGRRHRPLRRPGYSASRTRAIPVDKGAVSVNPCLAYSLRPGGSASKVT